MGSAFPWIFGLGTIALCLVPIFSLFRLRSADTVQSAIILVFSGTSAVLCILAGVWCYTSFYLKFIFAGVVVWVLWRTVRRRRNGEAVSPKRKNCVETVMAVLCPGLVVLLILTLKGCSYSEKPVDLEFPMTSGRYCVLQGGNSPITNPFHRSQVQTQRYAYDIVKLNLWGNRAKGISPGTLTSYACFGDPLFSPLAGRVVKAEDGHDDNPIGKGDSLNPGGNFVAIMGHDSVVVVLCHMMKESVAVRADQEVKPEQYLGKAGNSGHSSEPHLHIAAFRHEDPVPIRFDGRFLVINNIVIRNFGNSVMRGVIR